MSEELRKSIHSYNWTGDTAFFDVKIDTDGLYGYFEHRIIGQEFSGFMYFDRITPTTASKPGLALTSFEDVPEIPAQVLSWLREEGFLIRDVLHNVS